MTTSINSSRLRAISMPLQAVAAALLAVVLVVAPAVAGEPPTSRLKSVTPLDQVDVRMAPAVDIAALRVDDARREADPRRPGPQRFAAPLAVDASLADAGTWEELADGSSLWRLRLASPGALTLNLKLSSVVLPVGARLWLHSESGATMQGPYDASAVQDDGVLWTPMVLGDVAVLELHLPPGLEPEQAALEIAALNHGYRFFGEDPTTKQGTCNIDVVCSAADPYREQVRSVAAYSLGGFLFCTGTLMNNTALDATPYFLTADHCGISPANASSLVTYWNFESPTCGALSNGSLAQNLIGSQWLSAFTNSDFTLLQLSQAPPASYNAYFAGWDARGLRPESVVGVHHPSGDEKAISFEDDALDSLDLLDIADETHWRVNDWDLGTTEPGSSGSCIFDSTTRRCVGTLTGGRAACGNNDEDWYGKMSRHWNGNGTPSSRLSNWLDKAGTGQLFLDGADDPGSGGGTPPVGDVLELRNNRFEVSVDWLDFAGEDGGGRIVTQSSDSGLFYFFDEDNWELLVKVLDGCGLNQHYWVFSAATTDVEFTLTVTDTLRNVTRVYENPLGVSAPAITDTAAFATCP
ncbi:MAG: hypothetical protein AAGN46_13655 [Acidobacteriota bacterium]